MGYYCRIASCLERPLKNEEYCAEHRAIGRRHIESGIEEGEFNCEDKIYCPYCGAVHEPSEFDYMYEEDDCYDDVQCGVCEELFSLETSVIRNYSTKRKVDK